MVVSTVKYGLIVDGLGVLVLPILGNFHLEGVKACDCSHEWEKIGKGGNWDKTGWRSGGRLLCFCSML